LSLYIDDFGIKDAKYFAEQEIIIIFAENFATKNFAIRRILLNTHQHSL